jgi:hypothetical protein
MDAEQRWAALLALDDEMLKGGVMLSEWCNRIVVDSDTAYAVGAFVASILTGMSGIETYLRAEDAGSGRRRLVDLIEASSLPADLKSDLHLLRRYRNKWVHVDDPNDDSVLLDEPDSMERELEAMAWLAVRAIRRTIYSVQWV